MLPQSPLQTCPARPVLDSCVSPWAVVNGPGRALAVQCSTTRLKTSRRAVVDGRGACLQAQPHMPLPSVRDTRSPHRGRSCSIRVCLRRAADPRRHRRRLAQARAGATSGHKLKDLVSAFARQHSPGITIDFFAGASNKLVTRYAAWTQEAGAELTDAFSTRGWGHGVGWHELCVREISQRNFPPAGLEDHVVRWAKSDVSSRCQPIGRLHITCLCSTSARVARDRAGRRAIRAHRA